LRNIADHTLCYDMNDRLYNFYSIIVPSFNRQEELVELLASMQTLDFPRDQFEVIVVDDGSSDQTLPYLQDFSNQAHINFKFCTQQNLGPGAARNTGMEQGRGDFFLFIDSDCYVPRHWLKEIDNQLNQQRADACGGPDSFHQDFSPLLKAINYSMTSFLTTGGLRGRKGKKLARFYPRSFNMGLSRNLWHKIGGFGSLRHGQDIEFSNRILKSGARVIYVAGAFVYHKRRTTLRRFYRQVFNWGVARVNLYKIDKGMLEPLHALPALITLCLLGLCLLAVFYSPARILLLLGFSCLLILILFSMLGAIRKYQEIKPALLLPLIMPAQIIGYGLGFINNFIRRVILGKKEKVGFTKTYYK
jgi:glycosyltransferase involved in cell wall biosynthesis